MSLFEELKRRNVFRVGIAYVLLGWALLQGADFTLDLVGAPEWVIRALAVVVAIGLPIALFFAWAFELTPEGIKRESEIDRSESVMPQTARKLDRAIIAFLVLVIAGMFAERFLSGGAQSVSAPGPGATVQSSAEPVGQSGKSIAVLPFADLSQGQDQGWFADGLTEEILNSLAKTPDLLVASRTSSFNYKNSDLDISTIAAELGVATVLEGSVRSSGDRIRVTAQLIRAEDGFHIWSENYDRDLADVIAIQEDLARSIAGALETTMDPAALAEMASAGTRSVEAYRAYLQGVAARVALSPDRESAERSELEAYEYFEQARSLDPGFAAAHFGAAQFWALQLAPTRTLTGLTDLSDVQMAAEYQIRIDQAIAQAQSDVERAGYQGHKARFEARLRDAIGLFERYLAARPNEFSMIDSLLWVAALAEQQDIVNLLLDQLKERGLSDYPFAVAFVNEAHRHGRIDEAADFGLQALERWPADSSLAYQLHRTLLWAERMPEARAVAERFRRLQPESDRLLEARQACAEGDRAAVETLLAELMAGEGRSLSYNDRMNAWHFNMLLGDVNKANALLGPLAASGIPFQLADFMAYPQFDPSPFPTLVAMIERENIERPPALALPFACPPAEATAIAVLPFLNMSADADNEYFSDGVSEEILNVLAAIPDLKVASRTSAFRYKGSDLGIDEIADELGVTHVLEGSVRKAGDQVRITAQLIQASDGFHLWSETYDRELDNIFAIQDEIAGNIADVLEVQLLGGGTAYATVHDLAPKDYEKFLKARFLLRQRNDAAIAEAIDLTREVLANTPDFPIGLTQLAEGLVQTYREDGVEEIRALTDRALALEPDLAPAHMLEGHVAMDDLRPLEALRHFERAIALDPNEPRPHHWLGILLANSGYLDRAREELQTAVNLEPDHANANGYLGFVLLLQGDYDGAQRQFELQDRLGNPFGAQRKVQVAALKGDLALAETLVRERVGFTAIEAERLQLFIAALQDPAAVDDYVAFIDQNAMDDWHVALELSILGQYERTLAFDIDGGYPRWSWADRFVDARALPAFQQKIERANLPEVWDAIGPPPACRQTGNGYDCANGETP